MKKRSLLISIFFVITMTLIACSGQNTSNQSTNEQKNGEDTLKVYTTIFPLEDFTKKIGGDLVDVESIFPPGTDAHTYEPTTKTMVNIAESDAFIYSGVGIESFVKQIEKSLKNEKVAFIDAGKDIELLANDHDAHADEEAEHDHDAHADEDADHDHDAHASEDAEADHDAHASEDAEADHDAHASEDAEADHDAHANEEASHSHNHDHGDHDPHVWLDPILSITLAENIKNALIELHPDGKETFEANFQQLKTELEDLDQSFTDLINQSDKKEILVSHAAYGYWENRYGLKQISVLGLSPTEEPSQKELKNIIETAREHDLHYIIFEENVSSNVTNIVQNEIRAEALTLNNLETITDENVKNNEDYFSLMKKNLKTLETALSSK